MEWYSVFVLIGWIYVVASVVGLTVAIWKCWGWKREMEERRKERLERRQKLIG